jgi:hypothetical protein
MKLLGQKGQAASKARCRHPKKRHADPCLLFYSIWLYRQNQSASVIKFKLAPIRHDLGRINGIGLEDRLQGLGFFDTALFVEEKDSIRRLFTWAIGHYAFSMFGASMIFAKQKKCP